MKGKLHKQIQKGKLYGKQVLGDFSDQVGVKPIGPENDYRKPKKPFKGKPDRNKDFQKESCECSKTTNRKCHKSRNKRNKNKENNTKILICWKRKKRLHYANKCKIKKKINNLDIDEELKNSLKKLHLESSDSESENLKLSIITEEHLETESEEEPLHDDSEVDMPDNFS